MEKDILVTVRGQQFLAEEEGEQETIEIISVGQYFERNGKVYIKYNEKADDESVTACMLKVSDGEIELTKKGIISSQMVFRPGEKMNTWYETPYGTIMMGVMTQNTEVDISEKEMRVRIEYNLEVNCEQITECVVEIYAAELQNADIKLM